MSVTLLASASVLDRQSGRRGNVAYLSALEKSPQACFLLLAASTPLVRSAPLGLWFSKAGLIQAQIKTTGSVFLGVTPGTGHGHFAVALSIEEAARLAEQHTLEPTGDFRAIASAGLLPASDVALAGLARSLFAWHDSARHCGWCGAPTHMIDGGWKRHCAPCAKDTFPRLDPVVIMLIHDGDSCVLAHEPRYANGMFSCLAGYIEPGEDIAHAVIRETREEIGVTVHDVAILSSQPWPFPHSLMIGCSAQTGAKRQPLIIDTTEIVEARWFSREEASQMLGKTHPDGLWVPGPQAIAHHLIRSFASSVEVL